MNAEFFGITSAVWIVVSIIPYAIRVYQGKITPNLTSWSLWSLIGFAILITYRSSGAQSNVWPAIFSFSNPCLITLLILRRHGELTRPKPLEYMCLIFCLVSLTFWFFIQERKELAQFALYLALVADVFAAIPTIVSSWKEPEKDRPVAWLLFAIGYVIAMFAITEDTVANYILPIYMICGSLNVTLPLALYRWKQKDHLSEWI